MEIISAVIITLNEEHNIRYCLETVKWCDEIIVVDMESEDRTVEIAREFTDKIYSHSKILAFDIAKKYAVERAAGNWILLIDADEMISRSLATVLKEISTKNEVDVVKVPFKHYIMGEWVQNTGWGYTPLPRFFRKSKINFTGIVHNYMKINVDAITIRLSTSDDYCIKHFAYIDSRHFIDKLNKYTSIEAQQLFDQNKPFSTFGLLKVSVREFVARFILKKGYKDGVRGFLLSLMMSFYRALAFIKLWEHYEFANEPVQSIYEKIKKGILKDWKNAGK